MHIAHLRIDGFRGFDHLEIEPHGHVLLLGEPRAGRTDLVSAIDLVLAVDGPRGLTEFDFHNGDLTRPITIEATVIKLSDDQQQQFLDRLDLFDTEPWALTPVLGGPGNIPPSAEPAMRVGYHARWDPDEQTTVQNRYWVKGSDPDAEQFARIGRADRMAFGYLPLAGRRPLNVAPRGGLRSLIDSRDQTRELTTLLEDTAEAIGAVADTLASSQPVAGALADVLELLRSPLAITGPVDDLVRLTPDGGSLAAMLRGLVPTLDLDDGAGRLPLARHGSTTTAAVEAAELVTQGQVSKAIVTVDDFGDTLDGPTAQHLSEQLRRNVGQLWLSTRWPDAARGFYLNEVYRLSRRRGANGVERRLNQAPTPERRDVPAHRELHRQLLAATSARTIVIVEGPHDLAGYRAVERILTFGGAVGMAAHGARMIDPGPQGGITACIPLARLARQLGFQTIVVCDYDRNEEDAQNRLDQLVAEADHVVRLSKGCAIESALLDLDRDALVAAYTQLAESYTLSLPSGWESLDLGALQQHGFTVLKSNSGLHAQFAYATGTPVANLARRVLEAVVACAAGGQPVGHLQL
jgi:putative ATP-dependent endonuclease of OLD family